MISKKTKKDIIVLVGVWLFFGLFSLFAVNGFMVNKIENRIADINGYQAPKNTWFEGMKLKFDSVDCKGFFNYQCELKNFKLVADFKSGEEEILKAQKAIIHNAEKTSFNRYKTYFNIEIKGLYPVNKLKEIIVPSNFKDQNASKIAKKIENKLFPLDFNLIVDFRKDQKGNSIGTMNLDIKNNMAEFTSSTELLTILNNKNNYSVKMDSNGTIYHENNITNKKLAEFKMNQKYFTYLNKIDFKYIDKGTFDLLYDMYLLNMYENPYRKNYINNTLLGVNESEVLDRKRFGEVFLKRLKTYKQDNPNYLGKKSVEFLEKSIRGENPTLILHGKRKNNFTLEDYLVMTSMVEKDKEKLLEKHYDFNVTITTGVK